jgi:hypothetical protein
MASVDRAAQRLGSALDLDHVATTQPLHDSRCRVVRDQDVAEVASDGPSDKVHGAGAAHEPVSGVAGRVDLLREAVVDGLELCRGLVGDASAGLDVQTMSMSFVGLTTPSPRCTVCSWVIRPPTRVHLSADRAEASSATLGHGVGQPSAAETSMAGRGLFADRPAGTSVTSSTCQEPRPGRASPTRVREGRGRWPRPRLRGRHPRLPGLSRCSPYL